MSAKIEHLVDHLAQLLPYVEDDDVLRHLALSIQVELVRRRREHRQTGNGESSGAQCRESNPTLSEGRLQAEAEFFRGVEARKLGRQQRL